MARARKTLKIKLPTRTDSNRSSWRKRVLAEGVAAVKKANIIYTREDILEVKATVYLTGRQFEKIDVDNLLKDLCDALQGQPGGEGRKLTGTRDRVIWNDRQIRRATIEKRTRPTKLSSAAGGFLVIAPYSH